MFLPLNKTTSPLDLDMSDEEEDRVQEGCRSKTVGRLASSVSNMKRSSSFCWFEVLVIGASATSTNAATGCS